MPVEKLKTVRFARPDKNGFHDRVIEQVNDYFKSNNISPFADHRMWIKTIAMILMYLVPYLFMVSGATAGNPLLFFFSWFMISLGMVGIGTSIMHDANHGTYSPNQKINSAIGKILELIGGYTITWKIQHNQLHHTYTNIVGLDEDLGNIKLLRFSPQQPRYWFHKFQHLYVWFFYMLMTLFWMTAKDYYQILRYKKHDLLKKYNVTLRGAMTRITMSKLFYYSYIIVLPIMYSGMSWSMVLLGFLFMHLVGGLILSLIFQPAHIIEGSTFHLPNETEAGKREMEGSWAIHEVENTTDFAPGNRLLTWFIGGLNYQIEHHLFTGICHVHYPKLAPIVKNVAEEFGIVYNVHPTFRQAIGKHYQMLKKLGQE